MDKAKSLSVFLKSLLTVTSLSGLSMLCADSSGKLQKVGFNWNAPISFKGDIDQLREPGIYPLLGSTTTGTYPQGENVDGSSLIHMKSGNAHMQLLFAYRTFKIYMRMLNSEVWRDWREVAFAS